MSSERIGIEIAVAVAPEELRHGQRAPAGVVLPDAGLSRVGTGE